MFPATVRASRGVFASVNVLASCAVFLIAVVSLTLEGVGAIPGALAQTALIAVVFAFSSFGRATPPA